MKAITIHGLDDMLADVLKKRAQQEDNSINGLVKKILAEAMCMKTQARGRHRDEFSVFSGVWTEQDMKDFQKRNADFERVNAADWK